MDPVTTMEVVPAASTPATEIPVSEPGTPVSTEPVSETPIEGEVVAPKGAEPTEAEKRIRKLVAQRKEEERLRLEKEREVAYWKGLAEGRDPNAGKPRTQVPAAVQKPIQPNIDSFEKYEDYEAAKERFLVDTAKWELREEQRIERETTTKATVESNWKTRMAAAAVKHDDFMAVITNPAFIGKLEIKLTAPRAEQPKKIISAAPEPIKTVSPNASSEIDEQDLPMDEFAKRRNAKEYGLKVA